MDGFFVAKLKVMKRTSAQRANATKVDENDAAMRVDGEEETGEAGGFDSDEDKKYIEGALLDIIDDALVDLRGREQAPSLEGEGIPCIEIVVVR